MLPVIMAASQVVLSEMLPVSAVSVEALAIMAAEALAMMAAAKAAEALAIMAAEAQMKHAEALAIVLAAPLRSPWAPSEDSVRTPRRPGTLDQQAPAHLLVCSQVGLPVVLAHFVEGYLVLVVLQKIDLARLVEVYLVSVVIRKIDLAVARLVELYLVSVVLREDHELPPSASGHMNQAPIHCL